MTHEPEGLLKWAVEILKRQFLVAVSVFLSLVIVCVLIVALLTRFYSATALVVFDPSEAELLGITEAGQQGGATLGVIETEVEIARSADVLSAVIERLNLSTDDEFRYRPSSVNRVLGWIGLSPVADPLLDGEDGELRREAERTAVVQNLSRALNIRRQGITSILSISAESRSPEKAATIANAVAEEYIAFQARNKATTAAKAARLLSARVEAMSAGIRQVEDRLDLFIASAAERYGSGEVVARVKSLKAELERAGTGAERLRAEAASLAGLSRSGLKGVNPELLRSDGDIAKLMAERQEQEATLGKLQPNEKSKLTATRKRLAELDRDLDAAAGRFAGRLAEERDAADRRVDELRGALQASLADITIPNEGMVEFYTLQQEAKSSRDLYDATLSRLRQLELQANFAIANSRLVARALLPERISFPPVKIMLGLAFVLALAGAGAAAVLREQYIGGFRSTEQVEALTGHTVLASVPRYRPPSGRLANALIETPLSHYAETIRRARLNIEVSLDFPEKFSLMVTSTTMGEGKSTLSLALAETFAEAGRKTILVDADLRRPSIAGMVDGEVDAGLFDVLTRTDVPLEHVIVRDRRMPNGNLSFLFGADNPGLPTDRLVASDRFTELLAGLTGYFDVVIIDTPPIGHVVDAGIIAQKVDLSLYVVQWGMTSQIEVRTGIRELEKARARSLSLVVNQSGEKSTSSSAQGGYYYYTKG
ncbi:polysaccharide biosynthesis tyrosine autokinase [Stappia sp. F7233]|uniref:non-specific protein-tyrosine kinase n=1 Tax=Stappia albiluteola TaxID=2758565 RepID=A0A839ADD3_9HYPH|nr:polysaccharide biosynthesis tyrosine autokinase [Stappia albiluteola]MBA5777135.1 polysaccharide biosynthesis tyrosine autokinase [Stappia albiluteola]